MASFSFDNKTYQIPGVYGSIKVVNQVAAAPPAFNIALIIGKGDKGQPYDVVTTSPVRLYSRQNEVNDYYGADSDIAQAFEYFKKHGGLSAYCLNASDATKGTGSLQDSGPANVINLTAANWGDYSASIGLTVVNGGSSVVITITDPDDSGIRVVSGSLTTLDACVSWINENAADYFVAVKETAATNLPDTFTGPLFSNTSGYVAGTDPAPDSDDYDAIIAALPDWIEEFDIRLICPVVNESGANQHSIYQAFRDLAISQRTAGKPVQVVCGGLTGDIDPTAGDVTDPTFRANAYNNQDVILVSPGIDSLDPYKSSAPAVLGLLNAHGVAHNMTRDVVVASTLETKYSTTNLELLIDGGVLVFGFNKDGYHVKKGVNTLQANTLNWNISTKTTYLPMQRAIADYILKYFKDDLEQFIGADGVTKNQLAGRCARDWDSLVKNVDPSLFGENTADALENGLPYKTDNIVATTEGWLVNLSFVPSLETNYIGLTVQVTISY